MTYLYPPSHTTDRVPGLEPAARLPGGAHPALDSPVPGSQGAGHLPV